MGLRAILFFVLTAARVGAQTLPPLEIRGRVIEAGLGIGIAGAEVTLIEFAVAVDKEVTRNTFATAFTGSDGGFRFLPLRLGNYYLEVRKEGYRGISTLLPGLIGGDTSESVEAAVSLSRERPAQEVRFTMIRPGEITGRVLDEDRQPLAGLQVAVQQRVKAASFAELTATTGEDGSFSVPDVPPGEFFVRISPRSGDAARVRTQFPTEDATFVDQDIESAFWPGGLSTPSSNPVQVTPGAIASIGTVIARRVPYYRVRVAVMGECAPGEKWNFSALSVTASHGGAIKARDLYGKHYSTVACAPEFLVENLRPGSYMFALSGVAAKSAEAPVEITNGNLGIDLVLTPGIEINGRVTAADGAELPPVSNLRIRANFVLGGDTTSPDTQGKFAMRVRPWPRRQITVTGLPARYYVQEIRYNGRVAEQGFINATPGALHMPYVAHGANRRRHFLKIPHGSRVLHPVQAQDVIGGVGDVVLGRSHQSAGRIANWLNSQSAMATWSAGARSVRVLWTGSAVTSRISAIVRINAAISWKSWVAVVRANCRVRSTV